MRSCREITVLVSRDLDKRLSFSKRVIIGLHVMMCTRCRNFKNQTRFIRKAAHHYTEQLQKRLSKKSQDKL